MPKIAEYKFLIFFMVSFDLSEKLHLHVFSKKHNRKSSAKIWIEPTKIFSKGSLSKEELNLSVKLIENNKNDILKQIETYRKNGKVKSLQLKLK